MQATVDANGYMQVEQSYCSNYIITTIKPVQQEQQVINNNEIEGYWGETAVVTQQETPEETQTAEEVKSPATGDVPGAPWLMLLVLGQRRRLLG